MGGSGIKGSDIRDKVIWYKGAGDLASSRHPVPFFRPSHSEFNYQK